MSQYFMLLPIGVVTWFIASVMKSYYKSDSIGEHVAQIWLFVGIAHLPLWFALVCAEVLV